MADVVDVGQAVASEPTQTFTLYPNGIQPSKASPLVLLDLTLRPKEAYIILDALYEGEMNDPLDNKDVIDYIEARLVEAGLPLTLEEYQENYLDTHPENEQYKRLTYWLEADRADK